MATENVKKFMEALSEDSELQEKLLRHQLSEGQRQLLKERIVSIAREAGFSFTAEELEQYEADSLPPDGAMRDWDTCFCVAGGGGYNRTDGYSCACVVGGGGKADKDGVYQFCILAGRMQFDEE